MKNISVHIKKGEKTTFTFKKPIATYGTRIAAKEVTVFWNFRNITSTIGNHTFTITNASPPEKTINDGYYDFEQLKTRLENDKIELQMNAYDNTCTIDNKNSSTVNLKKLGSLLGFAENHQLAGKTNEASSNAVDVNHGLRWLTVTCDLIDRQRTSIWTERRVTFLRFSPLPQVPV